ncbi:MAG: cytochrome c-type biogenesis protein CcmH [candidate division KSB1 bacterium]|nr:cytochrome c-type biogenesis protein CcmH [candidate division KSB1 bacterium]
MRIRFWIEIFGFWLVAGSLAFGRPDSTAAGIPPAYLNALRNEIACFCGCGMTVQGCLGGMICSESRELSERVIALVSAGKTREQVLQAMVEQYGERILSAPTKQGFNLAVWVLPFLALLGGVALIFRMVSRWQRGSAATTPAAGSPAAGSNDEYGDRFEQEFRQFQN